MALQLSAIFFFFITTVVIQYSTAAGQAFPPLSPTSNDTEYIRTSCNTTRYPETCFISLANYSGTIQQDPGRLAMLAIHVALLNATNMAHYVSSMSHVTDFDNTTESVAIRDCSSVFYVAVDEIENSGKEMRRLGSTGESLRFQLTNVQTWMSAALTNEDTCMHGIQMVPNDVVRADVCDRVVAVMEVTSNALALVNSYAATITA